MVARVSVEKSVEDCRKANEEVIELTAEDKPQSVRSVETAMRNQLNVGIRLRTMNCISTIIFNSLSFKFKFDLKEKLKCL